MSGYWLVHTWKRSKQCTKGFELDLTTELTSVAHRRLSTLSKGFNQDAESHCITLRCQGYNSKFLEM